MEKKLAIFLGFVFFVVALLTLTDYGVNWDAINHLPRGQVYLRYFLTGKKDYAGTPEYKRYWQDPNDLFFNPQNQDRHAVDRVSLYQASGVDFNYYLVNDGGHPPLSDILSSFFNFVLFQKLGLINDIDAYRIYGILLAAILVGLIFWWVSCQFGKFAGFVASLALATYPLFWAESHLNTEKDVPETVFWSLTLFGVWKGVKQKSWKWLLASGVFFGLALGTKFNILFVGFVILPWLLVAAPKVLKQKWFIISSLAAVVIGGAIFIGSWPYLWPDIFGRTVGILGFYQSIGTTRGATGVNPYSLIWVATTTPIVTLTLALIGIVASKKNSVYFLFLFWLLVPIIRVMWPGASTYGGVRQIMEFIPALAIFTGLGAERLLVGCPRRLRLALAAGVILPFAFLILNLYRIHPFENAYFNPLIGGLAGAKERNLPSWGFTFGGPYRQGVSWLNEHAEPNAKLVFAHELLPNIPNLWLREDILLYNTFRTGYFRGGEYAITLVYGGAQDRSYYDSYVERFLNPVFVGEVDGVAVMKVWQNTEANLRDGYKREEVAKNAKVSLETPRTLVIDLGDVYHLARVETQFRQTNCADLESAYSEISEDGKVWKRLPGVVPGDNFETFTLPLQPDGNTFTQPFAADKARLIKYTFLPDDACFAKVERFSVYHFPDLDN